MQHQDPKKVRLLLTVLVVAVILAVSVEIYIRNLS